MANELKSEKKMLAVFVLTEGNSIRSIERPIGVQRDTIVRLGVGVGEGCQRIMGDKLRKAFWTSALHFLPLPNFVRRISIIHVKRQSRKDHSEK